MQGSRPATVIVQGSRPATVTECRWISVGRVCAHRVVRGGEGGVGEAGACHVSIHALIDSKDVAGATAALGETVSIVDKMATKGIIHTNTASRYKSRLGAGIARASA